MEVTKTLQPGDRGTARLLRQYGDRLVCVRYRHDPDRKKNITTVELVIDERDALGGYRQLNPKKPVPKQQVAIRVNYMEVELRAKVKEAGGLWDPKIKLWRLAFNRVQELGLEQRVVQENIPRYGHRDSNERQVEE